MPSSNPFNLTVIAVKILHNCRDYIKKCLKENELYYLNSNYEILDNGKGIKARPGYVGNIDDSFFELDEKNDGNLNISISAIVGKNGDGKSSLIELIIRLINNFACRKGLNPYRHLIYVNGVYAELYYKLNNRFYVISISNQRNDKGNDVVDIYEFVYNEENKIYVKSTRPLGNDEIQKAIFYTFVSNYSHFAYNTEEFSDELSHDDTDDHWLHKVFHKNDAYQTPLNLHPYRDKGNIDINRERLLSKQRLLISIMNSFYRNRQGYLESALEINGKIPYELRLWDVGKSKLQSNTLQNFFEEHQDINLIDKEVDVIMQAVVKDGDNDSLYTYLDDFVGTALSNLEKYYLSKRFLRFIGNAEKWIGKKGLLRNNSDLSQLIDKLFSIGGRGIVMSTEGDITNKALVKWNSIKRLSAIQFLRLSLVYDICKMWNRFGICIGKDARLRLCFNPDDIFKEYKDLSNAEKCCHYIIYKTIEIFNTYASYKNPLLHYASPSLFFSVSDCDFSNGTLFNLTQAFQQLSRDWSQQSHNTLKLRQAYSLLCGHNSSKKLYASVGKRNGKVIVFDSISEDYINTLSDIETLPPPIFRWEVMFRRNNEECLIPFNTFSSGEKQKMFFHSAIIYHLQNINSVGAERIHYDSVNLIFEEIELYFHPEWQRTLIFDFMRAVRRANIPKIHSLNIIFVTHSPYILSDIPKSNVLFLKEGKPDYSMQENTFGANINSLLKNGFFLPSLPIGEFAYSKINVLFGKLHSGQFDPHDIDQIYSQIMTIGEPAIRMQLMALFSSFKHLFVKNDEAR